MDLDSQSFEYEPVTRAGTRDSRAEAETAEWIPLSHPSKSEQSFKDVSDRPDLKQAANRVSTPKMKGEVWSLRRGHTFSFAALFLYSAIAYLRPYELTPTLSWTVYLPYWMAIAMLAIFIPSQLVAEGNLTARPREVNLVLLLALIAVISIPQAINPELAWTTFNALLLKTVLAFIVMVNTMRTDQRLKAMMLLSVAVGCFASVYSMSNPNKYGRAKVAIGNMFGDPNSLALHLVTMIPLTIALLLSTRNPLKKAVYGAGAVIMLAGTFATQSRGGFLGLVAAVGVLAFKLFRRNRPLVIGLALAGVISAVALAPGGYNERMASIVDPNSDASATSRRELLTRSISVALRSPFLGVGIGNFSIVGLRGQVTHNAFTQVMAEMGFAAFVIYVMFLIGPYKKLRRIELETLKELHHSRFYYLSVGLQTSLAGYMVGSFFLSVAYEWYAFSLVAYAICFRRLYETRPGAREAELADTDEKSHSRNAGVAQPLIQSGGIGR